MAEMSTGQPLFPGESDVDQLFHMVRCFGQLSPHQMEIFSSNPLFVGVKLPALPSNELESLERRFFMFDKGALQFLKKCLDYEPVSKLFLLSISLFL